jgi:hypothetical protein
MAAINHRTAIRFEGDTRVGAYVDYGTSVSSVVSHKSLNNTVTRVIPAEAGIQKRYTVNPVSSTEQHIV